MDIIGRRLHRAVAVALFAGCVFGSHSARGDVSPILQRAATEQAAGKLDQSEQTLRSGLRASATPSDQARLRLALANQYILTRKWDRAQQALQEASADQPGGDAAWLAALESARGNFHLARNRADQNDPASAATAHRAAVDAATQTADRLLIARASANFARAARLAGGAQAAAALSDAIRAVDALPEDVDRATLQLNLAALLDNSTDAHRLLTSALQTAKALQQPRLQAQATGQLAEVYLRAGQPADAATCARRAAFMSQGMPELQYRWQWTLARALQAQGDREGAIAAYRLAAETLKPIRATVAIGWGNQTAPSDPGQSPFRAAVGDLYTQLADQLLQRSAALPPEQQQPDLRAARAALEELKSAELEDYFQSDCATLVREDISNVEELIDQKTAVVYVVPLADRTELLVSYNDGGGVKIARVTAPVGRGPLLDDANSSVRQFRKHLEDRTGHEYRESGKRVYDALIAPIEPMLASRGIDTLVFVPDGQLRTVPMAAIWDGNDFLVARYAVAIVPGLSLMKGSSSAWERPTVLAAGLTQRTELRDADGTVEIFPSLRSVNDEIGMLRRTYGAQTILDGRLTQRNLQERIDAGRFRVVHLATHGEFRDESAETFILLADDKGRDQKLTLEGLNSLITPNQYRGAPVELLTLSACRSAAGDDRAALGLGGVALKAGARSSLATLWYVNDKVSADLVGQFYQNLGDSSSGNPGLARALQKAQLAILRNEQDRRYRHPCYWSPYVLIGVWK